MMAVVVRASVHQQQLPLKPLATGSNVRKLAKEVSLMSRWFEERQMLLQM